MSSPPSVEAEKRSPPPPPQPPWNTRQICVVKGMHTWLVDDFMERLSPPAVGRSRAAAAAAGISGANGAFGFVGAKTEFSVEGKCDGFKEKFDFAVEVTGGLTHRCPLHSHEQESDAALDGADGLESCRIWGTGLRIINIGMKTVHLTCDMQLEFRETKNTYPMTAVGGAAGAFAAAVAAAAAADGNSTEANRTSPTKLSSDSFYAAARAKKEKPVALPSGRAMHFISHGMFFCAVNRCLRSLSARERPSSSVFVTCFVEVFSGYRRGGGGGGGRRRLVASTPLAVPATPTCRACGGADRPWDTDQVCLPSSLDSPPPSKFFRRIGEAFNDPRHADVQLKCQQRTFFCHKLILSTQSTVFDAMFSDNGMTENESNSVDVGGMTSDTLEALLRFIYTENPPLCSDDVDSGVDAELAYNLFIAAEMYNVQTLKGICNAWLCDAVETSELMDAEFLCKVLELAMLHNDDTARLRELAEDAAIRNVTNFVKAPGWDSLKRNYPQLVDGLLIKMAAEGAKDGHVCPDVLIHTAARN